MGSESQLLLQILCMAIEKLGKGQRVRIFLKIVMFAQIDSPFFQVIHLFIFYILHFIFHILHFSGRPVFTVFATTAKRCSSFKHLVFLFGCPALLFFFFFLFLLLCKGDNNSTITCSASNSPLSPKRSNN